MPTVEDYFDDDTDLPLPSSSKGPGGGALQGSGLRGALLEEITDDDHVLDFDTMAEQGRGEYGAASTAPPPSSNKGKLAMREDPGDLRPSGPAGGAGGMPHMNPNTPMGGFMGDMMKLQEAEEARMQKMRSQFGGANVAGDPSIYRNWNSVYPLYFDAKVSINGGRRVGRKQSLWWPTAAHIAKAASLLRLRSVLEPEKTHPADWENPGRVKIQIEKDGQFSNPAVTNRTQLYAALAAKMQALNPELVPKIEAPVPKAEQQQPKAAVAPGGKKDKKDKKGKAAATKVQPVRLPSRPPMAPYPYPSMEERLPLHSPLVEAGVAVSAVKRDLETEKENKKKGLTLGGDDSGGGGKEKLPKMKRMVVRGGRR